MTECLAALESASCQYEGAADPLLVPSWLEAFVVGCFCVEAVVESISDFAIWSRSST